MSFVHLHCHSEYSLLDGANRIDDLIRRAQHFEQPALAITDHGNMHAAWEFQEKARKAGVKPIIGMEAYVAPGDRRSAAARRPGPKPYYHLVLLARDLVGYRNLVKLTSLGYTEGFYTKPRIDRELLAAHSEGLIVSSACLAGEVASHLHGRPHRTRRAKRRRGTPSCSRTATTLKCRRIRARGRPSSTPRSCHWATTSGCRSLPPTTHTSSATRITTRTTCCCASGWARIATTAIA
ncbi:MAG: PHP domain-containing protein [Gemmatimonadaceae bacterium]|nr:PHP domain-containing protein [Gemmatimonadaceae bacterium]